MKMLGFKILFLLLISCVALPLFMKGPDGQPIMTLDDWIPHNAIAWVKQVIGGASDMIDNASEMAGDSPLGNGPAGTTGAGAEIYTWRDENGVLHYSDTPHAAVGAEEIVPIVVPDDGLAIPANRFVQSGLAPPELQSTRNKSGGAVLLEERTFPSARSSGSKSGKNSDGSTTGASLEDLDAITQGDFSNAGAVIKDLPQLLEQLKTARGEERAQ